MKSRSGTCRALLNLICSLSSSWACTRFFVILRPSGPGAWETGILCAHPLRRGVPVLCTNFASGFCAAGEDAPPKRSAKAASVLRLLEAVRLLGRGTRVLSGRMTAPRRAARSVVPGQMAVPRRAARNVVGRARTSGSQHEQILNHPGRCKPLASIQSAVWPCRLPRDCRGGGGGGGRG